MHPITIELTARIVETHFPNLAEDNLNQGVLQKLADTIRGDLLLIAHKTGTALDAGVELIQPRVLEYSIASRDSDRIIRVLVVMQPEVSKNDGQPLTGQTSLAPVFNLKPSVIAFSNSKEEDRIQYNKVIAPLKALIDYIIKVEPQLLEPGHHVSDSKESAALIKLLLARNPVLDEIIKSSGVQIAANPLKQSGEPKNLVEFITLVNGLQEASAKNLKKLSPSQIEVAAQQLRDYAALNKPQAVSFLEATFLTRVWWQLSVVQLEPQFSPSQHYSHETLYKELTAVQPRGLASEHGEKTQVPLMETEYHCALSLLNEQGRDSFRKLLQTGALYADSYGLQLLPIRILNEVSFREVSTALIAHEQAHNRTNPSQHKSGVSFSDPFWKSFEQSAVLKSTGPAPTPALQRDTATSSQDLSPKASQTTMAADRHLDSTMPSTPSSQVSEQVSGTRNSEPPQAPQPEPTKSAGIGYSGAVELMAQNSTITIVASQDGALAVLPESTGQVVIQERSSGKSPRIVCNNAEAKIAMPREMELKTGVMRNAQVIDERQIESSRTSVHVDQQIPSAPEQVAQPRRGKALTAGYAKSVDLVAVNSSVTIIPSEDDNIKVVSRTGGQVVLEEDNDIPSIVCLHTQATIALPRKTTLRQRKEVHGNISDTR